jgi:hypothetical protein
MVYVLTTVGIKIMAKNVVPYSLVDRYQPSGELASREIEKGVDSSPARQLVLVG